MEKIKKAFLMENWALLMDNNRTILIECRALLIENVGLF